MAFLVGIGSAETWRPTLMFLSKEAIGLLVRFIGGYSVLNLMVVLASLYLFVNLTYPRALFTCSA